MPSNQQSTSPANSIQLATPADTGEIPYTRGISFAVAGALHVLTAEDEDVVIPSGALAAGVQHALCVKRIFQTGTTATGIVIYR